jgi:hypothetical protein
VHNWLRHKCFKSHTFNTCKWPQWAKKQNLHTKCFDKNKLVESTDHEVGISDATSTEVWRENSDEGSGSKAEMHKFHDVWKSGAFVAHLWFQ